MMLIQWLLEAVFDFECARCRWALSLDRAAIDDGLVLCPSCGMSVDTADLREMLCLAEWEYVRQQPSGGMATQLRERLLH